MTTPSGGIYFDTCTLNNFAVVGRLDLLPALYGNRCTWTDAVELEIRRGLIHRPYAKPVLDAAWLGQPVSTDDPGGVQQIDLIRRGLGGSPDLPRQHLAEAQAIHHIGTADPTGTFATDDRDAYELGRRRGIAVLDTPQILAACHQAGLLGCPEPYHLLVAMAAAGRGVTRPTHQLICPP